MSGTLPLMETTLLLAYSQQAATEYSTEPVVTSLRPSNLFPTHLNLPNDFFSRFGSIYEFMSKNLRIKIN
jgi:hypothetical protein